MGTSFIFKQNNNHKLKIYYLNVKAFSQQFKYLLNYPRRIRA